MTTETKTYVCVVGIDHPDGRNEPDDEYTGPASSVAWLLRHGAIVEKPAATKTQRGGR